MCTSSGFSIAMLTQTDARESCYNITAIRYRPFSLKGWHRLCHNMILAHSPLLAILFSRHYLFRQRWKQFNSDFKWGFFAKDGNARWRCEACERGWRFSGAYFGGVRNTSALCEPSARG